jgi:hypothetical protein
MAQDERRREQPDRLFRKPPGGSLRVLALAVLVAPALGSHGTSASPSVNLTITSYRVSVSRTRGLTGMSRPTPEKDHTVRVEKKR